MADPDASARGQRGPSDRNLRIGAVIAVALLVIFVAWLLLRGGDETPKRAPARAMNFQQLRAFARSVGHPVFWAGRRPPGSPRSGVTYEVSQTKDRSVYIRYLPPGVAPGADRKFLTVGTYLNAKARATVRQGLARQGASRARGPGGEVAVINSSHPNSVYFAAPNGRLLIEVFDPDAARARRIASTAGPIR